jgi:uncharacterized protein YbjT (DUF2867 family)
MEKILLTGATGYIGKRMISVIAAQGYKVYAAAGMSIGLKWYGY